MGDGMNEDQFNEWWDADQLTQTNPYREDSPAYWAWEGWQASTTHSASKLNLTRSEVSLMAGELSASEWRTIAAVLKGLQTKIRGD